MPPGAPLPECRGTVQTAHNGVGRPCRWNSPPSARKPRRLRNQPSARRGMMPVSTAVPGICNLCQGTVSCNRILRRLLRCTETNTGLSPSRDPGRRDRRRNALKAAYISVRSREQPHWLEC